MKYQIKVRPGYMSKLLSELNHWCVNPAKYRREGNTIFTSNYNVVDVAAETFLEMPEVIEITKIESQSSGDSEAAAVEKLGEG